MANAFATRIVFGCKNIRFCDEFNFSHRIKKTFSDKINYCLRKSHFMTKIKLPQKNMVAKEYIYCNDKLFKFNNFFCVTCEISISVSIASHDLK